MHRNFSILFFGVSSQSWLLVCFAARVDTDGGVLLLYTRRHGRGSRVELAHARRVPRPAGEGLELALAALLLGRARRADDAAVPRRRTARAATSARSRSTAGGCAVAVSWRDSTACGCESVPASLAPVSSTKAATLRSRRPKRIHGSCSTLLVVPSALTIVHCSASVFALPSMLKELLAQ
jgi:hypothetical protein